MYYNHTSNYDKKPSIIVPESTNRYWIGWDKIGKELHHNLSLKPTSQKIVTIECYQGILYTELKTALHNIFPEALLINAEEAMCDTEVLESLFGADITDDEIFGFITRYTIDYYFDQKRVEKMRQSIDSASQTLIVIYGVGAAYIQPKSDILVYADMARWEIQMRFRRNEVSNVGIRNQNERASLQYKRAFFVDWRILDRFKRELMNRWDYVVDTNKINNPCMAEASLVMSGLSKAVSTPFRVVPFFDPGPWGGQWMKEVCELDRNMSNFAWCFDCVPEENSLLLRFENTLFEIPSINLILAYPEKLLGASVHGRFGDEFPIRFDFLDTMGGGNLSLQVHPMTEYIQRKFGMNYTQDESYYILDAADGAKVYLGLKENVNPDTMITELKEAQKTGVFDAEKHVGVFPIKKHDHLLIPAGTIHCSGTNSMVLEISATPYIFTFKLWDWGRLGLDGRPRPINIEHGKNVIQWNRTESWVRQELINTFNTVSQGDGWEEEHTGLHQREFIETRRHRFSVPVLHRTEGSVNVLNLIEGREVIIESPTNSFEPFVVHYAETFIVPAFVEEYTISPYGESEKKECMTIKAFVRHHA